MKNCPRCGIDLPEARPDCPGCGVVFAKLPSGDSPPPPPIAPGVIDRPPEVAPGVVTRQRPTEPVVRIHGPAEIDPGTPKRLAIGLVAAIVLWLLPFTRFVFSYLGILIHELGHAAAGWLFGRPSLPAFDLMHGGGITHIGNRNTGLMVLLYGAAAIYLWRCRSFPRLFGGVAAIVAAHAVLVFSGWDQMVVLAMGHGLEAIFAGIFLYRAISGDAVRFPAERYLYSTFGWFLSLGVITLAGGILFDPEYRRAYQEDTKMGWHMSDLSRVSDEFFHVDVRLTGLLYLAGILAMPVVAWQLHRHGETIQRKLEGWLGGR